MGFRRNPRGPLIYATLHRINDVVFWAQTRPPTISPEDTDKAHLVTTADRIDVIADTELGDSELWWVILERNGLRLPPNDLVPGQTIFIPTRESLRRRGIVQ